MRPEQEDQPYFVTSNCLSLRGNCQEGDQQKKKKKKKKKDGEYPLKTMPYLGFRVQVF